jgi:hypothetical protein
MIPLRKFCSFQARDIDRTAGYSVPIHAEPFDVCAALTAEHEFSDLTHTVEVPGTCGSRRSSSDDAAPRPRLPG